MSYASEQTSQAVKTAARPIPVFNNWLRHTARNILRLDYKHRNDVLNLNARLRRDAGIDDIELERKKLGQAPLIR